MIEVDVSDFSGIESRIKCAVMIPRSIEAIEIGNIQRRMFQPLKSLTHM